MNRLLVTGFDPFGGDSYNPSGAAMAWLTAQNAQGRWPGASFHVLPVTWAGTGVTLKSLCDRERPDAVLMFGLACTTASLRLERCAYNLQGAGSKDNDGVVSDEIELVPGAAQLVTTAVDLAAMEQALRARGVPVEHSDDPGRCLCNAAYYSVLSGDEPYAVRALFVHVPPTQSCGGTLDDAVVQGWIEAALDAYLALTEARTGSSR
jgi:pyroglutamyl-peptidase